MDGFWLRRNAIMALKQEQEPIVLASTSLSSVLTVSSDGACQIWDPVAAWISPCAYSNVRIGIGITAVVILILSLFQLLPTFERPLWTRNFVKEHVPDEDEHSETTVPIRPILLSYPVGLFALSFLGLWPAFEFFLQRDNIDLSGKLAQWASHEAIWAASLLYVLLFRPRTASPVLLSLYILAILSSLVELSLFREFYAWWSSPAIAICSIGVLLSMPLRHPKLSTHEISKPGAPPTSELRSPEDDLALWQWLSVSWMWPMIKVGKARQMQPEDVWSLAYEFQHTRLHETFRLLRGSVIRRLFAANGIDLIITSLLGLIATSCRVVAPVLLQQLLRAMGDQARSQPAAIVYAVLILVASMVENQADVFVMWYTRRAYERSRGEMITMLYEKTLARKVVETESNEKNESEEKEQAASTGKILNIMRGDAYEISQRFWDWPELVEKPLMLIATVVLVWNMIGWPCLLGVGVIIIAQLLNVLVTKWLLSVEKRRRSATDDKLKVITQFVESIRHLRYNSWEGKWLSGILSARQKELGLRVKSGLLNNLISFMNNLASGLFPPLAFLAYTKLAGKPLLVDIAFPALQLFVMLDQTLREFPRLLFTMINAWVSVGRVEAFMQEPELPRQNEDIDGLSDNAKALNLDNASFAWPGQTKPVLRSINLTIEAGLTVVYGKVAAGKTAFLQSLLGENDRLSGEYTPPNAMIAYCAQIPWLQNMSIRENILFGAEMDMERYKNVLAACALNADLANFTNGDLSFIGENGIGLSGGQKARVALARAVYSRAPYLFLDDPISALDQQTAEHIMRKCIGSSLCADRTVVLVTHRLDLVQRLAQYAIEISGNQASPRNIQELSSSSPHFAGITDSEAQNLSSDGNELPKATEGSTEANDGIKDQFIDEEKRAHGGVKLAVYWAYITAGKLRYWALLAVVLVIFRLLSIAKTWFLKAWGESYDRASTSAFADLGDPFKTLPSPEKNLTPWIVGFIILGVSQSVMQSLSQLFGLLITYSAGKKMFHDIMLHVSNAAFRFYDVTPVGRLMNRMTGDIGVIDGDLGQQLQFIIWCGVQWIAAVAVIMSITPVFLIFTILITIAFVAVFAQFLPTSQNLRRLEMVSLSPLMANFGVLIQGLATVRAFRAQRRFQASVITVVDAFQKMDHFYWTLQTWLMLRFDTLSAVSTLALTIIAIYTNVSPGLTAFALIAATQFVRSTHALCHGYGRLELEFTSVERVVELLDIDQEPQGKLQPPAAWPTSGEIVFDHVNIRYADHLDPVLKDINITIPGGSNVAIIGRTGSGKSTLALALLATVRPSSGTIYLDNIDITAVAPAELRKRITFLAQEPTLFVGTMRENLDPLEDYSDSECSGVLERLCGSHGWTLDMYVEAGGKNLSQGQRQLVQLARAILRRSPLVILDEATASVDLGTSLEVQEVLRREMVGSTVLTIAHRVEAVAGADWCVELSKGEVKRAGKTAVGGVREDVQY